MAVKIQRLREERAGSDDHEEDDDTRVYKG